MHYEMNDALWSYNIVKHLITLAFFFTLVYRSFNHILSLGGWGFRWIFYILLNQKCIPLLQCQQKYFFY